MKKILLYGAVGMACLGGLTSCSDDYLQTSPITAISKTQITDNVETARMSMRGLAFFMKSQYINTNGGLFMNGEGTLQTFYGEGLGQDDFIYMMQGRFGNVYQSLDAFSQETYWGPSAPWSYAYSIIGEANGILYGIDNAAGDEKERNFVKAQVLTFRAYAYWRLLQFYAPRWEDANNGDINVLVERNVENAGSSNAPLMTMRKTLDMIYADLNEAIEHFEAAPELKRQDKIEPDIRIAYGIYARTAALEHDWATVEKMAHNARQGYTIMDEAGYKDGFTNYDNAEWMWCSSNDVSDSIYYWDNVAFYAANGAYIWYWAVFGAGAINMDLYRQMEEGDFRRDLFLTPDKIWSMYDEDWYDADYVNPTTMGLISKDRGVVVDIADWCDAVTPSGFNTAYQPPKGEQVEGTIMIPFGAHAKFFANNGDLGGSTLYMRAAEMLLLEAEAAAEQGKSSVAQNLLKELNDKRMTGYTCSKTGQELIDEVRLQRRIELWGEGHNFFDLKRWNLPCERKVWEAGNVNSGNIPAAVVATAGYIEPTKCHGWRFVVPNSESAYNEGFKRSELNY